MPVRKKTRSFNSSCTKRCYRLLALIAIGQVLLAILPGFIFDASAQTGNQRRSAPSARSGNTQSRNNNNVAYDTITNADPTVEEALQSAHFKNFLENKGINVLPFFPYKSINTKFLNYPVFRIYLAKESLTNTDDYKFVAVRCREISKTSNGRKISAYEDITESDEGRKKEKMYVIINFQKTATGEIVSYTKVTGNQTSTVSTYVKNFKTFMASHNLKQHYEYFAFVVQKGKKKAGANTYIKVQPIMPKNNPNANLRSDSEQVELHILDLESGSICCKSPPEEGADLGNFENQ